MKQHTSTLQRAALRTFVRGHSGSKALLKDRKVNDLTMAELKAMAAALAGDTAEGDALAATLEAAARQDLDQGDDQGDDQDDAAPAPRQGKSSTEDKQLASIRDLIMNGGFTAADPALRKLIADANKPAEVIEIPAPTSGKGAAIKHAKPTNIDQTWGKLFGIKGPMAKRTIRLWDGAHAETPPKDDGYVWPQPTSQIALSQLARGRNVFLFGKPGTGKTSWVMQFAAYTGRPYAIIECNDQTDAPTLFGMTVPDASGGTVWQDGILLKAIQTPGCVICIDEPSVARAGALMAMNNLLQYGFIQVGEDGRKVKIAKGVIFVACDNTNGTGGGARHGFHGTNPLNVAFLNRFPTKCHVLYMDKDEEADVIVAHTGCTRELAALLIGAATTTRAEAGKGTITNGLGLRSLFAWAELLTDGIAPRDAFDAAVLNSAPEADREALTQQCYLTYDKAQIAKALDPQPTEALPENTNPTDAGREAAEEFQS